MDFLEYIKDQEEREATLEVLASRELRSQLEDADRALQKGQLEDFIPWEKVRRKA